MVFQLFSEMTRDELRESAAAGGVLVVPLGALEQHGPHLPAATDALVMEMLLQRAAAATVIPCPLIIAPGITYGSSDHHLPFGGTISISTSTYLALLMDIGRSAATSGFTRLLFLNGHGGNHELAILAARDLGLTQPLQVACGSWWQIASAPLQEWVQAGGGFAPGHAGALESSLALTLFPQFVKKLPVRSAVEVAEQSALRDTRLRIDLELERIGGFTDNPSSAKSDDQLVTAIGDAIAREIEHFERATRHRASEEVPR